MIRLVILVGGGFRVNSLVITDLQPRREQWGQTINPAGWLAWSCFWSGQTGQTGPLVEPVIIFVKIMCFTYSLNFNSVQQQPEGAEDQLVLCEGEA